MRDLTLSIPGTSARRKVKISGSLRILNLSMLSAIVIFGLVYLFEINTLGTKGFEIKNLQQEIKQLQESQKGLQAQASDMQSIDKISNAAQSLNFVPVTNVTYLKAADYALK